MNAVFRGLTLAALSLSLMGAAQAQAGDDGAEGAADASDPRGAERRLFEKVPFIQQGT